MTEITEISVWKAKGEYPGWNAYLPVRKRMGLKNP